MPLRDLLVAVAISGDNSLHHSFGGVPCGHFGVYGLGGTRAPLTPIVIVSLSQTRRVVVG
ncbi:hypothetical protein BN2476_1150059 [Paraburkholderia piptadeniae]|uniref:Uncharacterized protein n=1 Tax=Paraburkholderia piptadeniae TaxID=1701573 RepID=A0A1N7SVD1_9BURK|nr:hypothetical protein BN2476_1150059 [Paraburkholderia piptadeniae]